VKSKEVKTGCNLVESSKEGYGSKMAVLPITMMMMIIMNRMIIECEAVGGIISDGTKRITRRKLAPVPLIHYDEGTSWGGGTCRKDKKLNGRVH
jgi:hypothetical protein